jgi:hypothetical protein
MSGFSAMNRLTLAFDDLRLERPALEAIVVVACARAAPSNPAAPRPRPIPPVDVLRNRGGTSAR